MVLLLEVTCIYLQQETPNQGGGGGVSKEIGGSVPLPV